MKKFYLLVLLVAVISLPVLAQVQISNVRILNPFYPGIPGTKILFSFDLENESYVEAIQRFTIKHSGPDSWTTTDISLPEALSPGQKINIKQEVLIANSVGYGRNSFMLWIVKVNDAEYDMSPKRWSVMAYNPGNVFRRNILLETFVAPDEVGTKTLKAMQIVQSRLNPEDSVLWVNHHYDQNPRDIATSPISYPVMERVKRLSKPQLSSSSMMFDRELVSPLNYEFGVPSCALFSLPASWNETQMADRIIESIDSIKKGVPGLAHISLTQKMIDKSHFTIRSDFKLADGVPSSGLIFHLIVVEDDFKASYMPGATEEMTQNAVARIDLTAKIDNPAETGVYPDFSTWDRFYETPKIAFHWTPNRMRLIAVLANLSLSIGQDNTVLNSAMIELKGELPTEGIDAPLTSAKMNVYAHQGQVVVDGVYRRLDVYTLSGSLCRNEALASGFYIVRVIDMDDVHNYYKVFVR